MCVCIYIYVIYSSNTILHIYIYIYIYIYVWINIFSVFNIIVCKIYYVVFIIIRLILYIYVCMCIYVCTRVGSVHVSVPFGSRTNSKWKWSSLSPWSGDFGVSRARACHYVVIWNALGEGSDVISSLSSAGMFPWQRSTVSVSRFAVLMSLMPFYCC